MEKMKLDIHIHSCYSDGVNTPKEIVKQAKKIGLDGIAITDHDEIQGSIAASKYNSGEFIVIPGVEISAKEGHINCLGAIPAMEQYLPSEEVVERIHEVGGIAIAVHPYDRFRMGVGDLVYKLKFDAIETHNGHTLASTRDMEQVAREIKLPQVGGSDAHCLAEIGNICVEVDNDPIESILNSNITIVMKTKPEIWMNYIGSKMARLI